MKTCVIVGCGGLFFHGLGSMSVKLAMSKVDRVVLLDHDRLEARNMSRQPWGRIGENKAPAAAAILSLLAPGLTVEPHVFRAQDWNGWHTLSAGDIVCAFPDNHAARKFVIDRTAEVLEKEVVTLLYGGNELDHGGVFGGKGPAEHLLKLIKTLHPEIWDESEKDHDPSRPACSAVPAQTLASNTLTTACLGSVLTQLANEECGAYEGIWMKEIKTSKEKKDITPAEADLATAVVQLAVNMNASDLAEFINPPKTGKKKGK